MDTEEVFNEVRSTIAGQRGLTIENDAGDIYRLTAIALAALLAHSKHFNSVEEQIAIWKKVVMTEANTPNVPSN